jgi:hypothetical protein
MWKLNSFVCPPFPDASCFLNRRQRSERRSRGIESITVPVPILPGGTSENSPVFQPWVSGVGASSLGGTAERGWCGQMSHLPTKPRSEGARSKPDKAAGLSATKNTRCDCGGEPTPRAFCSSRWSVGARRPMSARGACWSPACTVGRTAAPANRIGVGDRKCSD